MKRGPPGDDLFPSFLGDRLNEIVEPLAAVPREVPTVRIEHGVGAHGKIQVFRVGVEAAVDHRGDHADKVAALVRNRTTAVAGDDRSGQLEGVAVGAGNDSGAEREPESLRMADDE